MQFLSGLKIRTRLLLSLSFSVVALLALGTFSSLAIRWGAQDATGFIDMEFESLRALSDVRSAVGNARRFEKDIFLTMGDEKETERYTKLWTDEVSSTCIAIQQARTVAQFSEPALLDSMQDGVDRYAAGFKGILGRLERGELNDPWAANTAMASVKEDIRKTDTALATLSESIQHRANERRIEVTAAAARAPWLMAAATLLVSLVATLLALTIARSILKPILELQSTANAWGQGDPPCQTSCRPIMIAEAPHRIDIYEQEFVFN